MQLKNNNAVRWTHLVDSFRQGEIPHVIDVGARPSETPLYKELLEARLCTLSAFEPSPHEFEKLMQNKPDNAEYFCAALGDGTFRSLNLYLSPGFTSVLKPFEPSLRYLGRLKRALRKIGEIEVELQRMDEVQGLKDGDILKIDVQGVEREIIISGKRVLQNAIMIIPEVRYLRLYQGEPMFGEIDTFMRSLGFSYLTTRFTKTMPINSRFLKEISQAKRGAQAIDGDVVYIKDLSAPNAFSDNQIFKLCIAADALIECYDLALKCLEILCDRGCVTEEDAAKYIDLLPEQVKRS